LVLGILGLALLLSGCATGQKSALMEENASLKAVVDQADAAVRNAEERLRVLEEQLAAETALRKSAEEKVIILKRALEAMKGKIDEGFLSAYRDIREGFEINPESGGIILEGSVYFASGRHQLSAEGKRKLQVLADRLAAPEFARFNLRVDGHTDNQPIKHSRSRYRDNWELGFKRAQAVQDFFVQRGISKEQVFVASFADTRPIVGNDTAAGRAKNRRCEVQIMEGIPEEE
jgi:chemotaxis protein MotB